MDGVAMLSDTIRAIVVREFGPPDLAAAIEEVAIADPGPGEVRVLLHFAGISFVDVLTVAGKYQVKPALPYVPGSEFSGEVVAVGTEVSGLAPGDRVCGGNLRGIFAEGVNIPASRVQKLPADADMARAAVLRASYLTAWYALLGRGSLKAGETVVVLGPAGAVGSAACQIAAHIGATVIASASSEAKRQFALANGATQAIDAGAADWRDQVKALTGGRGADVVLDTVGGDASERAFRALRWQGRHLVVGFASGTIPTLPFNLALLKGASLIGVDAGQFGANEPEENQRMRREILALFEAGVLQPQVAEIFPLESFAKAMTLVAGGTSLGRVLLRFPH